MNVFHMQRVEARDWSMLDGINLSMPSWGMSKATRPTRRSAKPTAKGKTAKRKAGRPPKWTLERRRDIVQRVCRVLRSGGTVFDVCPRVVGEDADVPAFATFFEWQVDGEPGAEEFADLYARARDARCDALEEQFLRTTFDGTNDMTIGPNGVPVVDAEVIQRSKLISDNTKWMLAKLRRQRFGDTLDLTSNGERMGVIAVPGVVPLGSPLDTADTQQPKRKGKR